MLTTILRSKVFELDGFIPQCVVLRTQDEKPLDEPLRFMTHLEGTSDKGEQFTYGGNYDMYIQDAVSDFNHRLAILERQQEFESEVDDNN